MRSTRESISATNGIWLLNRPEPKQCRTRSRNRRIHVMHIIYEFVIPPDDVVESEKKKMEIVQMGKAALKEGCRTRYIEIGDASIIRLSKNGQ